MSKHYIFGDTHHGSNGVVEYLKKKGGNDQISASSTGDFYCYDANPAAPKRLNHPWTEAYKKGDKNGMEKHEGSWCKDIVIPYTTRSGKKFQELKPHLKGGKINAILGNSDIAIRDNITKYGGSDIQQTLGGSESAVNHISGIELRNEGKTTFVYMPHNAELLSQYKGKTYNPVKRALKDNPEYQKMLESIAKQIDEHGSDNVVVLVHEAPAPERWYKDKAKVESRLPSPLKAHYDSVLETIAKTGKKTKIFHGHLHEDNKKKYQYKGMETRLLDIGDIVTYDTETGQYSVDHVEAEGKGESKPINLREYAKARAAKGKAEKGKGEGEGKGKGEKEGEGGEAAAKQAA